MTARVLVDGTDLTVVYQTGTAGLAALLAGAFGVTVERAEGVLHAEPTRDAYPDRAAILTLTVGAAWPVRLVLRRGRRLAHGPDEAAAVLAAWRDDGTLPRDARAGLDPCGDRVPTWAGGRIVWRYPG